ncbi:MAG TPA: hypothetical protein VIH28_10130 [Ignavibacteriaceae bacterium]
MLEKIWQFLSGKKTIIGLALLTIAPHFEPGLIVDLLYMFGGTLAGVGVTHKAMKSKSTKSKG